MAELIRVAQVSAWGNLITILTLTLVIVAVLAIIAAVLWMMLKRSNPTRGFYQRAYPQQRASLQSTEREGQPQISINDLMQLKMLEMLTAMSKPTTPTVSLPASKEAEPSESPFDWLRR